MFGPIWPVRFVVLLTLVFCLPRIVAAEVFDLTPSDITTRSFSVVWASDEPVLDAAVRIFADPNGTSELTQDLAVSLVSSQFPPALTLGIVKMDVVGLGADTCVFIQSETTSSAGTVLEPPDSPLIEVCTEARTTKATASDRLIVNDLLLHEVFEPDGVTPAAGALLVLALPGRGANPLTAFVGQGVLAPKAVVDLNNLFDIDTGASTEVDPAEILTLTEFRGLLCPGLVDHRLLRFRRAPEHEEELLIGRRLSEVESPAECFFADTVCDDTVNILDAQRVLNVFGRELGECAFNPDMDVVADGSINILDVQSVLNRLGQSAPFGP
ncbi:MAG: hypothetical protein V3T24_08205 [Longimicrobiales bacterium]